MSGTLPSSYSSPVDFRISQTPPPVANLAEATSAISDIYAAIQQIIHTLIDINGIGPQSSALWPALNGSTRGLTEGNTRRLICRSTENLQFGNIISLLAGGDGKVQARLANATVAGRITDGYCSQPNGIVSGALGEVTLGAGLLTVSGLVVGSRYWMSTTSGIITNVPPTAAGNVEQYLGIAITTTQLWFQCGMWLQH